MGATCWKMSCGGFAAVFDRGQDRHEGGKEAGLWAVNRGRGGDATKQREDREDVEEGLMRGGGGCWRRSRGGQKPTGGRRSLTACVAPSPRQRKPCRPPGHGGGGRRGTQSRGGDVCPGRGGSRRLSSAGGFALRSPRGSDSGSGRQCSPVLGEAPLRLPRPHRFVSPSPFARAAHSPSPRCRIVTRLFPCHPPPSFTLSPSLTTFSSPLALAFQVHFPLLPPQRLHTPPALMEQDILSTRHSFSAPAMHWPPSILRASTLSHVLFHGCWTETPSAPVLAADPQVPSYSLFGHQFYLLPTHAVPLCRASPAAGGPREGDGGDGGQGRQRRQEDEAAVVAAQRRGILELRNGFAHHRMPTYRWAPPRPQSSISSGHPTPPSLVVPRLLPPTPS